MLIEMHFQFGIYFTFVQSYVLLYSAKFSYAPAPLYENIFVVNF
ncbi:hypothetical protein B4155_0494 [Bacillus cereus]|nr:hypothetical protein B4155_0494 [Bacillus cereus]